MYRRLAFALIATAMALLTPAEGWGQEEEETTDTAVAMVEGEVIDDGTGRPIEGAVVELEAHVSGTRGQGFRVTGRDGDFRFLDVPEGVYNLVVRAVGYDQMVDSLPVVEGMDYHFILPLAKGRGSLEPRAITNDPGREGARDYRGRRRRGGSGFLVTREQIMEADPRFVSEMLSRVPGGMLLPNGTGGYRLLLRNQCQPGVWLDGVGLGTPNIDGLVTPDAMEALEVYHGFELPVEFGVNTCGGILLWTRRGLDAPPPSVDDREDVEDTGTGLLGRLLQVALLVVAVVALGS
ncbi:MAG TPA: TonB-dependent receptor [Longimicrobiales bacterium]|nr:TonB-dependent receptor [Longimicrobiales bacterium]